MDRKLVAKELLKVARLLVQAETQTAEHSAEDLELYIMNTRSIYEGHFIPLVKEMLKRMKHDAYNSGEAMRSFIQLAKKAASAYQREFSHPDNDELLVNKQVLEMVAKSILKDFETEAKLGNYDKLLPEGEGKLD